LIVLILVLLLLLLLIVIIIHFQTLRVSDSPSIRLRDLLVTGAKTGVNYIMQYGLVSLIFVI
jgi:hypothetical protein